MPGQIASHKPILGFDVDPAMHRQADASKSKLLQVLNRGHGRQIIVIRDKMKRRINRMNPNDAARKLRPNGLILIRQPISPHLRNREDPPDAASDQNLFQALGGKILGKESFKSIPEGFGSPLCAGQDLIGGYRLGAEIQYRNSALKVMFLSRPQE